ncbi:hypothetical protein Glove_99g55 [Diversispora epigaea]|uniref:Uncharacterized protein n=1 Tax=Diversispora epigaea TaxID=1348612 RepID=A0A397J4I0_9GLOM|nr:hypothetical protein Glove_99g55 [Diversispora epigaea]
MKLRVTCHVCCTEDEDYEGVELEDKPKSEEIGYLMSLMNSKHQKDTIKGVMTEERANHVIHNHHLKTMTDLNDHLRYIFKKMFKQEPPKILAFPLIRFEWRILNVSMSAPDKIINIDTTLPC